MPGPRRRWNTAATRSSRSPPCSPEPWASRPRQRASSTSVACRSPLGWSAGKQLVRAVTRGTHRLEVCRFLLGSGHVLEPLPRTDVVVDHPLLDLVELFGRPE